MLHDFSDQSWVTQRGPESCQSRAKKKNIKKTYIIQSSNLLGFHLTIFTIISFPWKFCVSTSGCGSTYSNVSTFVTNPTLNKNPSQQPHRPRVTVRIITSSGPNSTVRLTQFKCSQQHITFHASPPRPDG